MSRNASVFVVFGVLCMAAISSAQPAAPSARLDSLLSAFAKMEGLEAGFVEEKRLQLLQAPLVSRGRLYFSPPGYLLRKIETPQRSSVLITPKSLIVDDGMSRQVIDLRARRDVRSFVASFVSLLAGDREALSSAYRIRVVDTAAGRWRMELTPKAAPLSDIIREVRVSGAGLSVAEIQVFDTNGDETNTRMLDVNPNRSFDASERRALFGIDSP